MPSVSSPWIRSFTGAITSSESPPRPSESHRVRSRRDRCVQIGRRALDVDEAGAASAATGATLLFAADRIADQVQLRAALAAVGALGGSARASGCARGRECTRIAGIAGLDVART